jgi:hypothetical protein
MKDPQFSNRKDISDYETIKLYQQLLRDGNVSDKKRQTMVETLSLLSQTNGNGQKNGLYKRPFENDPGYECAW